jgi:hypothetical protein
MNDAAISAATSSFFIAISLSPAPQTGLQECGGTGEMWWQPDVRLKMHGSKRPAAGSPVRAFEVLAML